MDFLVALGVNIITEIAKYTVAPIQRQLGYLYYYQRNIDNLNSQIKKLEDKEKSIGDEVEKTRSRGREPTKNVEDWHSEVKKVCQEVEEFQGKSNCKKAQCGSCSGGSSLNLLLRRKLSREAQQMVQTITSVIEKADRLGEISYLPCLRSSFKNRDFVTSETRMQTLEEIMKALKDPAHRMIGVHGVGGIGKSTLVKEVAKMAQDEELYSKVVMVTMSQTFDISEKQKEIMEMLDLEKREETVPTRAQRLKQGLRNQRKVLIVLDDIWENKVPDLSEIGIDFKDEQRDCKILLVSRDKHVLRNLMHVDESVEVQFLPNEEAMNLFKKFVGGTIPPGFESSATAIVKKCGGLPIAIVTIACTLKYGDITFWKDIVRKLESSPIDAYGKAYQSIKISYDSLASDEEKMLLLLCSLHDEDANIRVENLLNMFAAACNLFQKMATLEEARNSMQALLVRLKDRCLLLNGDFPSTVKMHDVIRDIMVSIASEDRRMYCHKNFLEFEECLIDGKLKDSIAISLLDYDFDQLPEELACPELKLLLVLDKVFAYKKRSMLIPDDSFEAMKKLRALCICSVTLDRCPSSLCSLQNLQTLSLRGCKFEDIVLIGELKNLIVLDLSYSSFKLLPEQIGKLTRLRQLNLNHCKSLQVIWPNVLSSLVRLEELYMDEVYITWESGVLNGDKKSNASLTELMNLKQLRDLHLYLKDATSLPKGMFVGENLERYHIIVGSYSMNSKFETSSTALGLKLEESSLSYQEYGFQTLMKKSEVLCLGTLPRVNNIAPQLDIDGFPQLKNFTINCNDKIRHIVESCNSAFPNLETLNLKSLSNLEAIVYGRLTTEPFGGLRRIKAESCSKLKNIFSFSIARNLEEIYVSHCTMMKEIVYHGSEDDVSNALNIEATDDNIEFPTLQLLSLQSLPNLIQFFGSQTSSPDSPTPLFNKRVVFPTLKTLRLANMNFSTLCPDRLPTSSFVKSLSSLSVNNCGNLKHLLTFKIARSLKQLEHLKIYRCSNMEELIVRYEEAEEQEERSERNILLPRLRSLELQGLRSLKRICTGDFIMVCESLLRLNIKDCPQLRTSISNYTSARANEETEQPLFIEKITSPRLEYLTINFCRSLKYLLSCTAASSLLHLKSIYVNNCEAMEEMVVMTKELPYDQVTSILFPNLVTIELSQLANLKRLSSSDGSSIECPFLVTLKLQDCPKLATIAMTDEKYQFEKRDSVYTKLLANEKIASPCLENLSIKSCNSLKYLLSCSATSSLLHLKSIDIDNCEAMEQIVMMANALPSDQVISISFSRLETVRLHNLENLKRLSSSDDASIKCSSSMTLDIENCRKLGTMVMKDENYQVEKRDSVYTQPLANKKVAVPNILNQPLQMSFRNLQKLNISKCNALVHLFPFSAVESLAQLKDLRIVDCAAMEVVVTAPKAPEEDQKGLSRLNDHVILFPKLEYLSLLYLPKLKMFCEGDRIECSSLLMLTIFYCNSLSTFVAVQTAPHTLTVPVEQEDLQVNPQSLSNGKVVFPKLETLSLCGKSVYDTWQSQFSASLAFPKRFIIKSDSPRDQTSFIPFDIHIPQNQVEIDLEGIWVEKIWVRREIGSVEQHDHVTLTHLTWLKLCRIPKLMQLGPVEPDDGQLPQTLATLETPEVERHLRLKTVVISSSVSFPNLTILEVERCHSIINLLSSSAAKSLVRLQRMIVRDCKQLREIVIGDKLEGEAENSSGIVFSRLEYITLHRLPSLKRFYGGDSNMEFPLLTKVIVSECPEMEIFSNGSTSTPELHKVFTKEDYFFLAGAEEGIWEGDLNASVRQNWENVHSYDTALQRLFPETNDWDSDDEHMAVYQEVQSSGGGTDSFLE